MRNILRVTVWKNTTGSARRRLVAISAALGLIGSVGAFASPASANPPGEGGAPGYAGVLQIVYSPRPSTSVYGPVWVNGTFGAKNIGGYRLNIDTDRDGRKETVLGYCIEFSNGNHPPQTGAWRPDPGAWGQDPPQAPPPVHRPSQKDFVKVSYVLWKYGRSNVSNAQAAAVSLLVHFYGQDRAAGSLGNSTVVPDLNNNDIFDEGVSIRTTAGATSIDELMRQYDAEAERWGSAFAFKISAVKAGVTGTATGLKSTATGRSLPAGTFVKQGGNRFTAALARPMTAGEAQSVIIAGGSMKGFYTSIRVGSSVSPRTAVVGQGKTHPFVETIVVTGGTPNGFGELEARIYDRVRRRYIKARTPVVGVNLDASGSATVAMPAINGGPGKWEFTERFTDFGPDFIKGGTDDVTVARDARKTPVFSEQFEVRAMSVETRTANPKIAIPGTKLTAANIVMTGDTVTISPTPTVIADPILEIADNMRVTGATPGGQVQGTVTAYPLISGVRDCTRPSATVTMTAFADFNGTVVMRSPKVAIDAKISDKWEFIEAAKDLTSGVEAARVCASSPVIGSEVSAISYGVSAGIVSKVTAATGSIDVGTMRATITDMVAVYGGFEGQRVAVSVVAVPINENTGRRDCARASRTVTANLELDAFGVAAVKMPSITVSLRNGITYEFLETARFQSGPVVTRSCTTSPRIAAETVRFDRPGDDKLWKTGADTTPTETATDSADEPEPGPSPDELVAAAPPAHPVLGSISIPRLDQSSRPIYELSPSSTDVTTNYYHRDDTEPLCSKGNPVIAAHRTTYNAPLRWVNRFQRGDIVDVATPNGSCRYRVVTKEIVPITDSARLKKLTSARPLSGRDATLTMFTCTDPSGTWTSLNFRYFVVLERI